MPRNTKAKPIGQSRKKTTADELYNARRRAKRAIARLEKEIQKGTITGREKAATEGYIKSLRETVQKTYAKRGIDKIEAQRAAKALDVQTLEKGTQTAEQRRNIVFERQIYLAGAGMPTTIAKTPEAAQAAVKIFYKATQHLWQGLPVKDRNKAIMARLAVSSLHDAFIEVMRQNPEAFRAALDVYRPIEDTDEEEFFAEPGDEGEMGSPPYLAYTNTVEQARQMEA